MRKIKEFNKFNLNERKKFAGLNNEILNANSSFDDALSALDMLEINLEEIESEELDNIESKRLDEILKNLKIVYNDLDNLHIEFQDLVDYQNLYDDEDEDEDEDEEEDED